MTTENASPERILAQEMMANFRHPKWDVIVEGNNSHKILRELLLRRIPAPIADQLRDPSVRDADTIGDIGYAYKADEGRSLTFRRSSNLEVAYVYRCYGGEWVLSVSPEDAG